MPDKIEDFGERTTCILRRLHKADRRDTGMRLSVQDVADLAYCLSNQIASVTDQDNAARSKV